MFRKNLSEKIRVLKTDINVRKQELAESLTEAVKVNMCTRNKMSSFNLEIFVHLN